MKSDEAVKYIKSKNPSMPSDVEKRLTDAINVIDEEKGFLDSFSEENLNSLYKIEMINTGYFPGLSIAAAKTMVALHSANPKLPVSLLLSTAENLAGRGRPWESLGAFSRIAKSCPKQINEDMLTYLSKVNSNILEICGHQIEEETDKARKAKSGVIGILSSFLSGPAVEVDITKTIDSTRKSFSIR